MNVPEKRSKCSSNSSKMQNALCFSLLLVLRLVLHFLPLLNFKSTTRLPRYTRHTSTINRRISVVATLKVASQYCTYTRKVAMKLLQWRCSGSSGKSSSGSSSRRSASMLLKLWTSYNNNRNLPKCPRTGTFNAKMKHTQTQKQQNDLCRNKGKKNIHGPKLHRGIELRILIGDAQIIN